MSEQIYKPPGGRSYYEGKTTYTVVWERLDYPEDGKLRCLELTERDIVRRMIGAIKNTGPVIIHSITRGKKE